MSRVVANDSGSSGASGSSNSYTMHDWTNELNDDTAVEGNETIHAHTHNYMDWYWSGGTGTGSSSGSGSNTGEANANEPLTIYSVNEAGSGSMSVTSAPASGGFNTFSDIISGGGSPSLNEVATNEFYLSGGANAGSAGITSTFALQSNGTENLNLSTSLTAQRGGSSGSSGSPGTGGSGSDSSYLNDVAQDSFSYSGSGGNGPSGPTSGTFSLTSSGSDNWTKGVSGGGSTSAGATDSYNVQTSWDADGRTSHSWSSRAGATSGPWPAAAWT